MKPEEGKIVYNIGITNLKNNMKFLKTSGWLVVTLILIIPRLLQVIYLSLFNKQKLKEKGKKLEREMNRDLTERR